MSLCPFSLLTQEILAKMPTSFRSWVAVGRGNQVAKSGEYFSGMYREKFPEILFIFSLSFLGIFSGQLAGEPYVVVRDGEVLRNGQHYLCLPFLSSLLKCSS